MKKFLALIMACAMVLSLAACGSSSSSSSSSTEESEAAETTTVASEEEAEETIAASESAEDEDEDSDSESDGDLIVVGFAQVGHESDWRTASTQSCQEVFTEENGYDLIFIDCDQDSAAQLEAVRSFIEQDVDYIIIDPIVSTGWDTVLTECEDAGIPVIVIDRTIDDSTNYAAWVGSDFTAEGLAAGEWLNAYAEAMGIEELNILVIEGTTGSSAQLGRTEGFNEIAEKYGWTILDSQDGDFTESGGQEVMESFCKSYEGQFNVVICQNDNEAFGAMTAMDNAGVTYGVNGDVILISFDACTAGLEEVQAGNINADFECNPLAAPFVEEVIQQLEAGETPEQEVYMEEHWYTYDDTVSTFEVNGETQEVTVVTDEIVDAQY
ncbi:MAG: ABC transporter substrate-binding protein [Oscillospiraceae bacterium]|nr:ABC transporter substrate-binding protein [Oscillospiraceae bacterium]